MIEQNIGEFSALLTAFFWTFTALSFTSASHKIGSLAVNFWRLIIGIIFISSYTYFFVGTVFPTSVSLNAWFWLSISGFIGIFLGDLFLFKSFNITGPRVSLLIMSISPPIAASLSWMMFGDKLSFYSVLGMLITTIGIILVIFKKNSKSDYKLKYDKRGIVFAVLGALGQSIGLVFSKVGINYVENPFVATQIRLYAGLLGFIFLIFFMKRWKTMFTALKEKKAFGILTLGSFFGPFLGISFSLIAVKHTNPGIVQTITSITPILIIPFSVLLYKEKIRVLDFIGAVIAIIGVSIFFIS